MVNHTHIYTTATLAMVEGIRTSRDEILSQLFKTNQFDNHTEYSSMQILTGYLSRESYDRSNTNQDSVQVFLFF